MIVTSVTVRVPAKINLQLAVGPLRPDGYHGLVTIFHAIGLFDQEFDACEDVEFNERVHAAGLTCYFTPAVKIVYEPRGSFRALFYQLGRYGGGRAKLACKHPKSLSIPALVPPLWAVWVILGGLLSVAVPYFGWLWLASLALYASVLLGAAVVLGRCKPLSRFSPDVRGR